MAHAKEELRVVDTQGAVVLTQSVPRHGVAREVDVAEAMAVDAIGGPPGLTAELPRELGKMDPTVAQQVRKLAIGLTSKNDQLQTTNTSLEMTKSKLDL